MLADLVGWTLALSLAVAAVLKLRAPAATQAALAVYGLEREAARCAAWAAAIAAELGLAVGLALGSPAAAYAAAALCLGFAAALAIALARGRGGRPCGCLGARSRVGPAALARALALAAACAAVPSLRGVSPSTDAWLAAGLGLALIGVAALGVGLLALAREVGELRLRVGPQSALEIAGEGPEIGSRSDLVASREPDPAARLALAVFTSEACPICRTLEPAIKYFARDPFVSLHVFDEYGDAAVWRSLDVPGSPYAVALGLDGTVLAKGTFNSLGQLESVLASAERREREAARA